MLRSTRWFTTTLNKRKQEAEAQRQRRGTIDGQAQRKLSNQTHRSRTDPDATLAQKQGTPRQLKYKVHQTIDADSRVILDTEVTTGARHDNQPYLEQLQRVRDQYKITIHEATADRGYGSAEIIQALQEQGNQDLHPAVESARGRNSGSCGRSWCTSENTIAFAVPRENIFIPSAGDYWNRTAVRHSSPGQCRDCPLASTCPAKNRPNAPHTAIRAYARIDQDLFEEVQAQMNEPNSANEVIRADVEDARDCSPRRSRTTASRGRSIAGEPKVQIQAYLCAIVQNLKRLLFPLYCWLFACLHASNAPCKACVITNAMKLEIGQPNASTNQTFSTRPMISYDVLKPPGTPPSASE